MTIHQGSKKAPRPIQSRHLSAKTNRGAQLRTRSTARGGSTATADIDRGQQPVFMNLVAGRIDQLGMNENQQIALAANMRFGTPQPANERKVAEERHFIVELLHIFTNQTAQHNCLAVPDDNACRQVTAGEQRLLDVVLGGDDVTARSDGNWAAIVDEA